MSPRRSNSVGLSCSGGKFRKTQVPRNRYRGQSGGDGWMEHAGLRRMAMRRKRPACRITRQYTFLGTMLAAMPSGLVGDCLQRPSGSTRRAQAKEMSGSHGAMQSRTILNSRPATSGRDSFLSITRVWTDTRQPPRCVHSNQTHGGPTIWSGTSGNGPPSLIGLDH